MLEKKISTGRKIGRVITKTTLILGTVGVVGYSMLKGKILGRPPSKIRKGLLYATLAGVILYKCQGDKVKEVYDYASLKVSEAYSDFYELKKSNNNKINYLMNVEDSLRKNNDSVRSSNRKITEKNIEINEQNSLLEKTIENYLQKDTVLAVLHNENAEILGEKNNLESKLSSILNDYDKKIKQLEGKLKEKNEINTNNANSNANMNDGIGQKNNSVFNQNYLPGKELLAAKNSQGNYIFYDSESSENADWIWTFADGNVSMNDLCVKYYNNKNMSDRINDYNKIFFYSDDALPEGMPVALIEKGILTREKVYKGGFPKAIRINSEKENINDIIKEYYSDDQNNFDVLSAIKKYNMLYNKDLDELVKSAEISNRNYYVLIPRFLKFNLRSSFSEIWVGEHAKQGEY